MRKLTVLLSLLFIPVLAYAGIFSQLHGVVHDPQHRPVAGAHVTVQAAHSAFTISVLTAQDGSFTVPSLPLGDYVLTIANPGFASSVQPVTLASDTSPILHVELALATVNESVTTTAEATNVNTVTPTTLVDRQDIALTPGADRTDSLAAITDFTPGAYMTHDMLHMRGGHQVSWLIDGVAKSPIPTSPPTSEPQIDPKRHRLPSRSTAAAITAAHRRPHLRHLQHRPPFRL